MSRSGSAAPRLPYVASLRVYEPLAAFEGEDRLRWMTYVAARDRLSNDALVGLEQQGALRRAMALPVEVAPDSEHTGALVVVVDGVPYVCPLDDRLRVWAAVETFADEVPEPLLSAFLPGRVAGPALADYADWRRSNIRQPRIRSATWHVPAEWFAPFAPEDRQPGDARTARYLVPMGRARRRLAQALDTVRRAMGEGPVTGEVEDLARWLEEFHPRAQVELDYGGLAALLGEEGLAQDASVEDVSAGLAALRAGDAEGAAEAYARLTDRWLAVRALEHSS